jgi:hypothetical protein
MQSVGVIVRKQETEYRRGSVNMSKYVVFNMHETIEQIDAYLNSKHISGETDSLGREKPFFNISVAASNIWFHATDIDRKNIKLRATNSKSWINSYLYTVKLQEWMREERFGQTLNTWGRTLARYGSAVLKVVENDSGLHITVTQWQRLICDPVEFGPNPKIELIDVTHAQLAERVQTMGYYQTAVDQLIASQNSNVRETMDHNRKDNRNGYIRLYEVHGKFTRANLLAGQGKTAAEIVPSDERIFMQQMHVIAYVKVKVNGKTEWQDFTLFAGEEEYDPYMITHLIEDEGRTLSRGAVENLFQAQWMVNHSMKVVKDTLDLASKLIWQTADPFFVGQNVLENIESGDILVHAANAPLTKLDTSKVDIMGMSNYAVQWKQLGNEINSISDVMLGHIPHSGTAFRQVNALLQESYSLFEIMIENKAMYLEDLMRRRVLPYIKKKYLNNSKEIAMILEDHDIEKIDSMYLKNEAIKLTNKHILNSIDENLNRIARGEAVQPIDAAGLMGANMDSLQQSVSLAGNVRYFKPSDLSDMTWAKQLEEAEVDIEIDISGEEFDSKEMLGDLATALQMVLNPNFATNKKAQAIVGRMLELTGAMSPVEYNALPDNPSPTPTATPPSPLLASTGSGH